MIRPGQRLVDSLMFHCYEKRPLSTPLHGVGAVEQPCRMVPLRNEPGHIRIEAESSSDFNDYLSFLENDLINRSDFQASGDLFSIDSLQYARDSVNFNQGFRHPSAKGHSSDSDR